MALPAHIRLVHSSYTISHGDVSSPPDTGDVLDRYSLIPTTNSHDRPCDMVIYFGGENAGRPRCPLRLLFTPCQLYSFFSAAAYPILLFVYLGADRNIYPVAASYHMNVEPL